MTLPEHTVLDNLETNLGDFALELGNLAGNVGFKTVKLRNSNEPVSIEVGTAGGSDHGLLTNLLVENRGARVSFRKQWGFILCCAIGRCELPSGRAGHQYRFRVR